MSFRSYNFLKVTSWTLLSPMMGPMFTGEKISLCLHVVNSTNIYWTHHYLPCRVLDVGDTKMSQMDIVTPFTKCFMEVGTVKHLGERGGFAHIFMREFKVRPFWLRNKSSEVFQVLINITLVFTQLLSRISCINWFRLSSLVKWAFINTLKCDPCDIKPLSPTWMDALFSQSSVLSYSLRETQTVYRTKWSKSEKNKCHMISLICGICKKKKKRYRWIYLHKRNRLTDIED